MSVKWQHMFYARHHFMLFTTFYFLHAFLITCLLNIIILESSYLHKIIVRSVECWVFTPSGQPQIDGTLGPFLTLFFFFSSEFWHILNDGTTAHLGLVS